MILPYLVLSKEEIKIATSSPSSVIFHWFKNNEDHFILCVPCIPFTGALGTAKHNLKNGHETFSALHSLPSSLTAFIL